MSEESTPLADQLRQSIREVTDEPVHDGALVPATAPDDDMRTQLLRWRQRGSAYATSLDLSTTEGKLALIRARGARAGQFPGGDTHVVLVKDWVLRPVELVDRATGEVTPTLMLTLIAPDNSLFATFSGPIVDSWRDVCELSGGRTFDPPIRLTLVHERGSQPGGYWRIGTVEFVVNEQPGPRKGK